MTATVPSSAVRRRTRSGVLIGVGNEVAKGLRHGWSERTQIVIEMPLFASFMLLVGFIVGHGTEIDATGRMDWTLETAQTSWLFLGMAVYIFVYLQIQKMFWRLLAEVQTGTLEQTYLSPLPSWVHAILGRTVAATIESAAVVAVTYGVTSLAVRLEFAWRLDVLVPLTFLLLGTMGFSLMIAGLTVRWKRIEMLNDFVLLLLMFFSGVVIDVDRLPAFTDYISPYLFLTQVNESLRTLMLDDQSLSLWGDGGYVWLAATGVGWFVAGLAIFRALEHTAKRTGTLNRY